MITAIEIDGAGGDPAAWRGLEVDPRAILTGELAIRAVQRAEAAGFGLVTVMDHFYQIRGVGPETDPMLEAYSTLAAIATYLAGLQIIGGTNGR